MKKDETDIKKMFEIVTAPPQEPQEPEMTIAPEVTEVTEAPEEKNNKKIIIPAKTKNTILKVTKPLMKGKRISELHVKLKKLGLKISPEEEKKKTFGKTTAYAIRIFQRDNGLIVSGKVEKYTAEKLEIKL